MKQDLVHKHFDRHRDSHQDFGGLMMQANLCVQVK